GVVDATSAGKSVRCGAGWRASRHSGEGTTRSRMCRAIAATTARPPCRAESAPCPFCAVKKTGSLSQRPADDVADVPRQAFARRPPFERRFGAGAPAGLERAPALEGGEQPCRHLRVLLVERQHGVGDEGVAGAVGPIELALVRLREGADQRTQTIG